MEPTNTGSFGAAIGGMTPELQAAVQRRPGGQAVPSTSQVSNSAPTANPTTQTPPMAQSAPQSDPMTSPTPQMPFDSGEAKMIIQSLGTRLKALSKMQGM